MPIPEWFFIMRSNLLMKSEPSIPIQHIRLGWHRQEWRKARDTHAARAASLNDIRECIWHQISSGRLGTEYLVLLAPSESATWWQNEPFLLASEAIEQTHHLRGYMQTSINRGKHQIKAHEWTRTIQFGSVVQLFVKRAGIHSNLFHYFLQIKFNRALLPFTSQKKKTILHYFVPKFHRS